uniref:C-type lectin domain-containing protein n=1 Tax=Panagrolaimus sp. JU765 TaxID=591449 RepID=A0AC34QBM1_9BILA
MKTFNGITSCYLGVTTTGITQTNALIACSAQGATLASIHSAEENAFIYSEFNDENKLVKLAQIIPGLFSSIPQDPTTNDSRQTWIGLVVQSYDAMTTTLRWYDGTPVDYPKANPFTYAVLGGNPYPFVGAEPYSPYATPCFSMFTNTPIVAGQGGYNDIDCSFLNENYVCKKAPS